MKASRALELSLPLVACFLGFAFLESFSWVVLKTTRTVLKTERTSQPETIENVERKPVNDIFALKTHKEYRLARPAPYRNSEYFSWFIKEEWSDDHPECKSNIVHDGKGYSLKESDTPQCKGYTRIDGKRLTTDVPKNVDSRIWLFGGSTVQNHEVPNEYTVASYLQRMVNKSLPAKRFGVENRGFSSVTVNQQNDLLGRERVRSGDIVIYLDGINNQFQGVANNRPQGNIIRSNRQNAFLLSLRERLGSLNSAKLIRREFAGRHKREKKGGCIVPSETELRQRAEASFSYYLDDLLKAKRWSTMNDVRFIHFMQPHLFSDTSSYSSYERSLINTMPSQMVPCGADRYMITASKIYRRRHHEILSNGIESYDLGSLFAERSPKEEIFLDFMHVTEGGNRRLAREILKYLGTAKD